MEDARQGWPALMDARTAADYLQLTRGALLGLLSREKVEAIDVGAKLRRWRKRDLDEMIAQLPAYGSGRPAGASGPGEGGMDRALAAVERRAAAPRPTNGNRHEVRQSRPAS